MSSSLFVPVFSLPFFVFSTAERVDRCLSPRSPWAERHQRFRPNALCIPGAGRLVGAARAGGQAAPALQRRAQGLWASDARAALPPPPSARLGVKLPNGACPWSFLAVSDRHLLPQAVSVGRHFTASPRVLHRPSLCIFNSRFLAAQMEAENSLRHNQGVLALLIFIVVGSEVMVSLLECVVDNATGLERATLVSGAVADELSQPVATGAFSAEALASSSPLLELPCS